MSDRPEIEEVRIIHDRATEVLHDVAHGEVDPDGPTTLVALSRQELAMVVLAGRFMVQVCPCLAGNWGEFCIRLNELIEAQKEGNE